MQTMRDRYDSDPQIRAVVDYMEYAIQDLHLTPEEVRHCAMLAEMNYERRRARYRDPRETVSNPVEKHCSTCGNFGEYHVCTGCKDFKNWIKSWW